MPLTFLAGVYGMNFELLPELKIRWFYPALWGAWIAIAAGMLAVFRWRRWI
jgi:magnesium transporter